MTSSGICNGSYHNFKNKKRSWTVPYAQEAAHGQPFGICMARALKTPVLSDWRAKQEQSLEPLRLNGSESIHEGNCRAAGCLIRRPAR